VTDALLSLALGIGLAAACGFRIFVPLLALSIAAKSGYVPLSGGFEWIASTPALLAFATATILEIAAYYVTWLDHVLDVIATPAAMFFGAVTAASVMTDLPPLVRWTAAVVGGGGAAGVVQGATVLMRLKSAALTGGLANPLVATAELFGSVTTAVLALVVPLIAILLIACLCAAVFLMSGRFLFGRLNADPG
jgi:hypothetical protein